MTEGDRGRQKETEGDRRRQMETEGNRGRQRETEGDRGRQRGGGCKWRACAFWKEFVNF